MLIFSKKFKNYIYAYLYICILPPVRRLKSIACSQKGSVSPKFSELTKLSKRVRCHFFDSPWGVLEVQKSVTFEAQRSSPDSLNYSQGNALEAFLDLQG